MEHKCLIIENMEWLKSRNSDLEIAVQALDAIKTHMAIISPSLVKDGFSATYEIANNALNKINKEEDR